MIILFGVIIVSTYCLSAFYWLRAVKYLSEKGKHDRSVLFLLGPFAGKEYFTELGWRYVVKSVLTAVVGFLMLILIGICSPWFF
jgi:hypothetical protein